MSKKQAYRSCEDDRATTYNFYYNKYYNLFMNSYKWTGLDYQQIDYLMRRFWSDGKVAAFIAKHTKRSEQYPLGLLVLTPFAAASYNLYDFPIEVTLVNKRGVAYIPTTPQKVDEEVVLGYSQRNKKSVFQMVDYYLRKIVDVEMVIRTNLIASKTPYLIGVTPETKQRMENLWNNILNDNPRLFVELDDAQAANPLVSGAPYIIDKLKAYKDELENELKEYLGINNLGVGEKKEHLIGDEVSANNEVVANSGDCFFDVLTEFCERVTTILEYPISVELNQAEAPVMEENKDESQEEGEEE